MNRPPGQEASVARPSLAKREAWALVLDQVVALEEDAHGDNGSDRHRGPKPRFCAERVSPITLPAAARSACAPGAAGSSSVCAAGVFARHCAIRAAREPGTRPRPPSSWPSHAKLRRPQTDTAHGCTQRLARYRTSARRFERGAFSIQSGFGFREMRGYFRSRSSRK